jgi:hypothetical protein
MSRKSLFLIPLLFFCFVTNAQQFPSEIFHDGKVELASGDTISGKIKYNLQNDLVEVITGGVVQTFTARKIIKFTIFDKTVDMYRTFYAVPYYREPNYKVPMLFEVLYEGKLSLLARESLVQETVPQYNYYYRGNYNITQTRIDYQYFFLDNKGNFRRFMNKKADLLDIMARHGPQIKQYLKKNHLKMDSKSDLVRITSYYNSL